MSDLEARYRRALAWYPREWREQNADAVIGTLLDVAESRERPRPGELATLRLNGIRERMRSLPDASAPIRERAALVGFGVNAAVAVAMLGTMLWQWMHPSPQELVIDGESAVYHSIFDTPQVALIVMYLAMVVAGGLAVARLVRSASVASVTVLLVAIAALVTMGPIVLSHLVIVAALAVSSLLRPRTGGELRRPARKFLVVFGITLAIIPVGLGVLRIMNLRYSGRPDELVFNSTSFALGWLTIAALAGLSALISRSPRWSVAILLPFWAPFGFWAAMAFIIPGTLGSPYALPLLAYVLIAFASVAVLAVRRGRRTGSALDPA